VNSEVVYHQPDYLKTLAGLKSGNFTLVKIDGLSGESSFEVTEFRLWRIALN
jgi:hypothetical protein